jgi:hypothetical protein
MIRVEAQKEPPVDQRERFLRLVAAIAESWAWIVLVPLIITVATYAYLQSKSVYASEAILRLSSEEVLILKSGRVFAAEVAKSIATGIVDTSSVSLNVTSVPAKDDLYQVSVSASSPGEANAVAQGLISSLIASTKLNKERAEALDEQLVRLKSTKVKLSESLDRVNKIYDNTISLVNEQDPGGASQLGNLGASLALLVDEIAKNGNEIANVETALKGTFTGADVILAPTDAAPVAKNIGPFVTLAFVLSLTLVLIVVLVRDALRGTQASATVTRIRRAIVPSLTT